MPTPEPPPLRLWSRKEVHPIASVLASFANRRLHGLLIWKNRSFVQRVHNICDSGDRTSQAHRLLSLDMVPLDAAGAA